MGRPGSLGAHVLAVACAVTCAGCSTAPVFGEAGGGGAANTGATTATSGGAAPSTSSQGVGGEGGGDGGRGGDGGDGGVGAGGQGGDGGGCVSDCGERRCGLDACGRSCGPSSDTWARNLPESVSRLVLRPGTSDLYVVGNGDRIERVDVCLGGALAGRDVHPGGSLRGVGVVGDELVVGVNDEDAMEVALRLEPATFGVSRDPLPLPVSSTSFSDRIWGGTAHDGALWLGLDDDGSALVRVRPASDGETPAADRFQVGDADGVSGGRGLASSPFGLIHQQGDATLALVDPGSCAQGVCEAAFSPPLEARGFQVTYAEGQAFVPSFESGHGRLMRVAVPAMEVGPAVQRDVDGLDDGFTDVAVHEGVVYVVGFTGGLAGSPWLVTYPPDFETLTPPLLERVVAGAGGLGWAIAADASGVYVAGSHENGGGFVIKCTHALECPAIGTAVEK